MHRCRHYLIAIVAIAAGPGIFAANSDSIAKVDLPGLIRQGPERNPSIKTALIEWQATVAKLPQAVALPGEAAAEDAQPGGSESAELHTTETGRHET